MSSVERLRGLYLDLLQKAVSNGLYQTAGGPPTAEEAAVAARIKAHVHSRLQQPGWAEQRVNLAPDRQRLLDRLMAMTPDQTAQWLLHNNPPSHTLLGPEALDNIRSCIEQALSAGVPGDLMECGVYRGGAAILMRGVLRAHGDTRRRVWLADSFQGLPQPDPGQDLLDAVTHEFLKSVGAFRVSLDEVKDTFRRYDLLDEQVQFLPGWFADTLPGAPVERLALLRLDGDYYDSTRVALQHLYPRLSPGGFLILDDYAAQFGAKRAIDEYRTAHHITAPLLPVNLQVHFWRKPSD